MMVTNEANWLRTKRIFTLMLLFASLWAMGGLEGTEPMPHGEWLLILMPSFGYMVWNITKHYPR
jgi:hypothetical protein